MINKRFWIIFVSLVLLSSVFVMAEKSNFLNSVKDVPSSGHAPFTIPKNAVQISPDEFSLGEAIDSSGRIVQGYLYVHEGNKIKPVKINSQQSAGDRCYLPMADGARWKKTENYAVGNGLDNNMIKTSMNTWDSKVSFHIFGNQNTTQIVDGADLSSPDGKNEVMLENLGSTNTIAYAVVWGVFYGPIKQREIVEWDIVFNSNFPFGDATVNPNVMDYQNIATHELGHALGLSHPSNACTEETMYAYASYGETKKRTLNNGDIAGVRKLY